MWINLVVKIVFLGAEAKSNAQNILTTLQRF